MRRVLLGVVVGMLLQAGSTSAATSAPQLRLVTSEPVVLAGVGFRPHEKVRLLITPGPATRTVRAGARGRFRATIRFAIPRCGGLVVQAIGNRGSRAMIDRPGPDCTPID